MRGAAVIGVASLLGTLSPLRAQPTVTVGLTDAPVPRAVVRLSHLLADGQLVGAMESGFPLYVEFRVQLRESRPLWDRDVSEAIWEYVVLQDPVRERYRMEYAEGTEIVRDLDALSGRIGQAAEIGLTPDRPGTFYYQATVEVRTLDDGDVDEVFAWLKGEDIATARPDRPGTLTRAARRLLVAVAPLPRVRVDGRSIAFVRQ